MVRVAPSCAVQWYIVYSLVSGSLPPVLIAVSTSVDRGLQDLARILPEAMVKGVCDEEAEALWAVN